MNIQRTTALAGALLALVGIPGLTGSRVVAQTASWSGGDGDWTDSNWSRGNGPNGTPAAGQDIRLPSDTGTLRVTTNLADDVGSFNLLGQIGGTLDITPTGALNIDTTLRIGDTASGDGVVNVFGELNVFGGLDVAYGNQGSGDAGGELNVGGSGKLLVGGTMDTWWVPGARFSVSGPDAQIEITQTYFHGPSATLTANINSDAFSTINVLESVSLQGGQLDVKLTDGYVPALGSSWTLFDSPTRTGQFVTTNFPDLGPGSLFQVNYTEGGQEGQIITVDYVNTLNVRVDPVTGEASIENPLVGGLPYEIDGYIIRSDTGSLREGSFTGLGQPGWLPGLGPSQSNNLLSETNFTDSTLIPIGESMSIGNIFDPAGTEDLMFEFHVRGGPTLPGTVQYADGTGPALQAGDADQNLEFDQLDIIQVQVAAKYLTGQAATWGEGDWDGAPGGRQGNPPQGDGLFDQLDIVASLTAGKYLAGPYAAVQSGGMAQYGPTSVISIPEPAAIVLVALGLLGVLACRRRGEAPVVR
jgi:hypothetical protein